MSHFAVLVIGENPEKQLAPYHEFECTGEDDQYVENIDKTEEARERYESQTTTKLKDEKGNFYCPYDDRFYREPTKDEIKEGSKEPFGFAGIGSLKSGVSYHSKDWGDGEGYRPKINYIPEGFEKVEMPTPEVESFAEFASEYYGWNIVRHDEDLDLSGDNKYGFIQLDEKGDVKCCVDRTNPNAKWDWHVLGGRWTGFFKAKKGATGLQGRPGLMTDPAKNGYHDAIFKRDVDIEAMRNEAGEKALREYELVESALGGKIEVPEKTWDEMRESMDDIGEARDAYWAQPPLKKLKEAKGDESLTKEQRDSLFWIEYDNFCVSKEAYVERARKDALTTFAIVKDSKWYERGEMGWWACVSNEKDKEEWQKEFDQIFDELPDDTLLSVYDCHI